MKFIVHYLLIVCVFCFCSFAACGDVHEFGSDGSADTDDAGADTDTDADTDADTDTDSDTDQDGGK